MKYGWRAFVAGTALLVGANGPVSAAPYVLTLTEHPTFGGYVQAVGIGEFDLSGLTSLGHGGESIEITPAIGYIVTGLVGGIATVDAYSGLTGPSSFGTGIG